MKIKYWSFLIPLIFFSCASIDEYDSKAPSITHEDFDALLKKYVTEAGNVNYQGFIDENEVFESYLKKLAKHHPNKSWSSAERLAYWINAYNAFTLKLVLDHYPVASIKDIKNGVPFVNTVWDIKFIKIEGQTYDLNNIEHGIIRKRFNDPRIHFAVNCASFSCPKLRNEAFTADRLNEQLDDQARYFVNNKDKNIITSDGAQLSKIFLWYGSDFKKNGSTVRAFINKYTDEEIAKDTKISYLDYKWNLNE